MRRTQTSEFKRIKKERLEEIGRCELCGSKRGLDLHHIIPRCVGGGDDEDNLILICSGCHGKLTPKSELVKLGQRNTFTVQQVVFPYDVYKNLNEMDGFSAVDVLDLMDEVTHFRKVCIVKEKETD